MCGLTGLDIRPVASCSRVTPLSAFVPKTCEVALSSRDRMENCKHDRLFARNYLQINTIQNTSLRGPDDPEPPDWRRGLGGAILQDGYRSTSRRQLVEPVDAVLKDTVEEVSGVGLRVEAVWRAWSDCYRYPDSSPYETA